MSGRTKLSVEDFTATPAQVDVVVLRDGYEARFSGGLRFEEPDRGPATVTMLVDGRDDQKCVVKVPAPPVSEGSDGLMPFSCTAPLRSGESGSVEVKIHAYQDHVNWPRTFTEQITVALNTPPEELASSPLTSGVYCPLTPLRADFTDEDASFLTHRIRWIPESDETPLPGDPTPSVGHCGKTKDGATCQFNTPEGPAQGSARYNVEIETTDLGGLRIISEADIVVRSNAPPTFPPLTLVENPLFAEVGLPPEEQGAPPRMICAAMMDEAGIPRAYAAEDPDDEPPPALFFTWTRISSSEEEVLVENDPKAACLKEGDGGLSFLEGETYVVRVLAVDECGLDTFVDASHDMVNIPPTVEDVYIDWGDPAVPPSCESDVQNPDGPAGAYGVTKAWYDGEGALIATSDEEGWEDKLCELHPGQVITCEATARDAAGGMTVGPRSAPFTVPAPSPDVVIFPPAPGPLDDLTCEAEEVETGCLSLESSADAAQEGALPYTYRFVWGLGTQDPDRPCGDALPEGWVHGAATLTLGADDTAAGERWCCYAEVAPRGEPEAPALSEPAVEAIRIGPHPIARLEAGRGFTCLLNEAGALSCWGGSFEFAETPFLDGDTLDVAVFNSWFCVLSAEPEGRLRCYDHDEMATAKPYADPFFALNLAEVGQAQAAAGLSPKDPGDRIWIGRLGGCHRWADGTPWCWYWPRPHADIPPQTWMGPGWEVLHVRALALGGNSQLGQICGIFEGETAARCCPMPPAGETWPTEEDCFRLQDRDSQGTPREIHAGEDSQCLLSTNGRAICRSGSEEALPLMDGERFRTLDIAEGELCGVLEQSDTYSELLCSGELLTRTGDTESIAGQPLGLLSIGHTHGATTDPARQRVMMVGARSSGLTNVPDAYR